MRREGVERGTDEETPPRGRCEGVGAQWNDQAESHPPEAAVLRAFRARLYATFGKRADALFELTDAILTAGSVSSPPHHRIPDSLTSRLHPGSRGLPTLNSRIAWYDG